MAIEKKVAKKTVAAKAPVKKVASAKPAAVKPAELKIAVKKTAVKKPAVKKPVITQDRFYAMVSEAAYFAAQNDCNRKGSVEYWMEAESGIRTKFDVA
jgi:predicted transcriptional regulator